MAATPPFLAASTTVEQHTGASIATTPPAEHRCWCCTHKHGSGPAPWLPASVVEVLVESGAKDADGATALHQAALFGHVEVLRVLVESGVNKESKAAGGATALHQAAGNGHVEAIRVLAQLGARLDAQTNRRGGARAGSQGAAQGARC